MTEQNSPGALGRELASTIAIAIETNPKAWTRPWSVTGEATPHNPMTHEIYRGINRLVLSQVGYVEEHTVGAWATKQEWRRAGLDVGPDSAGVAIVVPSETACCNDLGCDDGCGNVTVGGFRTSTVFHHRATGSDQAPPTHPRFRSPPPALTADRISEMFDGLGATIETGYQPYYSPTTDRITIPTADRTASLDHWVSILAREHIHWTGHPSRLNRRSQKATSRQEALQRLVGEVGGLLLANSLGLHYHPGPENQSIRHAWVSQLRSSTGGHVISETVASACAAAQFITSGLNIPTLQTGRHQPTATEPTTDHELADRPMPTAKSKPKTKQPRRPRLRGTLFARKPHSQVPLTTPTEPNPEPVTDVAAATPAPDEEANENDRRKAAGWIMERVAADDGDHEIASQTIAGLLDLPAEHCRRPPAGAPPHAFWDERLRVAKWMLEQVMADNDDPAEGAHLIGHLLGIAPQEIQAPQNERTLHL